MKVYRSTGEVVNMPDPESTPQRSFNTDPIPPVSPSPIHNEAHEAKPPPGLLSSLGGGLSGLGGGIEGILSKLSPENLETEDILLMLILYFLYRESKDEELLIIMALMFLL